MLGKVITWLYAEDWHTWIGHALLATLVTALLSLWFHEPYLAAIGGYCWHEGEEIYFDARDRGWSYVRQRWVDHCMDLASPTVAALLVGRLLA